MVNSKTTAHIQFEVMNHLRGNGKFIGKNREKYRVMILLDARCKGVARVPSLCVELILDQADNRDEFGFLIKLE
jgi:hypothetical protein